MRKRDKQAIALIIDAGGKYLRHGKHGPIYVLPNGKRINFSGSTGDVRAIHNLKAALKRALAT